MPREVRGRLHRSVDQGHGARPLRSGLIRLVVTSPGSSLRDRARRRLRVRARTTRSLLVLEQRSATCHGRATAAYRPAQVAAGDGNPPARLLRILHHRAVEADRRVVDEHGGLGSEVAGSVTTKSPDLLFRRRTHCGSAAGQRSAQRRGSIPQPRSGGCCMAGRWLAGGFRTREPDRVLRVSSEGTG